MAVLHCLVKAMCTGLVQLKLHRTFSLKCMLIAGQEGHEAEAGKDAFPVKALTPFSALLDMTAVPEI